MQQSTPDEPEKTTRGLWEIMGEWDTRILLRAQLQLLTRRVELGLPVGVSSMLHLAWLVRELEGHDS